MATPSSSTAPVRQNNQIQRPISPPTPAPSPQPEARLLDNVPAGLAIEHGIPTPTQDKGTVVDPLLRQLTTEFPLMSSKDRYALLSQFVDLCSARELAHLSSLISPRLKVDFLSALPIEVSLQIISHLDDPRTLARASGVSRFWRSLVNDEQTWKIMCKRYHFRQVPTNRTQAMTESSDHVMDVSLNDEFKVLDIPIRPHGSSQVLGHLYDAYRARGLDPSTALSELKALHELFLSKRAREMGVEERRRQLHALQHDNVFFDLVNDNNFIARMAEASMSEDDKQFYRQLDLFVRDKEDERIQDDSSSSSNQRRSSDVQEPATVGWLSTGPPSTRTMAGPQPLSTDDPRTPIVASSSRYFAQAATQPLRDVGRSLVSPTSRLGTMTSGLLTSLWDRTGVAAPASSTEHTDRAPSHPPSTGDHGHSAQGHNDVEESEEGHGDGFATEWERSRDAMQIDGSSSAHEERSDGLVTSPSMQSIDSASRSGRVGMRKTSRRFTPFSRSTDEVPMADTLSTSAGPSIGLGRPSSSSARGAYGLRSITTDAATAASSSSAIAVEENMPASRRAMSMAVRHSKGKPFSYKNHFKLAYQTESNWLRGGRLLTQHVSSDDASGEGATVTSLSIDEEWIVVGMANAKIHAFDARTGLFVRTLNGHTAGVWCLALISASSGSGLRQSASSGKGKANADSAFTADEDASGARQVGAYPYDNDRPLYTPTPDLNLIHHDPRPAASTYSPDLRQPDSAFIDGFEESSAKSTPPISAQHPAWNSQSTASFASQFAAAHSEESLSSSLPPPRAAFEAVAAARSSASAAARRSDTPGESNFSRGAGLGSNFGSPCGSVTGYGNEHPIVVSSGCDRDVRVWDLATGECKFVMSGHRSTVRCLRVFEGRPIAVSGSRDGTMRVWNVETGQLQHLLPGHQHSVRCIDLAGNLIASASYDCTARIWNVDTGKCLHVLRGHYHQLYAIAFDGVHVATGSLDSTVRIWDADSGRCMATLHGHQSLVGQLQLTDSTLITGGSDGKVIVFSLKTMKTVFQLLAHETSVTCLQFDDRFIVTGGNDGKVKLWNFRTGEYVRELCQSSDQVWKVSFRDDKCVVLCRRNDKTAMDVISFRPIEENVWRLDPA